MTALTLRLRESGAAPVDVSHLVPGHLDDMSAGAVADLPLWRGAERLRVGDVFEISGDDTQDLVFETEAASLWGVGYGMRGGRITVQGPVGAYAGRRMQGGELVVHGEAGAYAGNGMRGGHLRIEGDAGDYLGAARPGERYGMEGGLLLVRGNAGDRAGERMRRGNLLIEGSVGAWCAARMRAGTIGILGGTGPGLGWAMRRGTILMRNEPEDLSPLFRGNGEHSLSILSLMAAAWRDLGGPFAELSPRRVRRWLGDRSVQGLGELLVMAD